MAPSLCPVANTLGTAGERIVNNVYIQSRLIGNAHNNITSVGPNVDPCGTPYEIGRVSD